MTCCRIYRGYGHFLLQLPAPSAHPKTPQSSPAAWAEGVADCPGWVWALREDMNAEPDSWPQGLVPQSNDAEQHWHFYTEKNGAQRPHKESIRYYKRMQNKGGTHTHREYQMDMRKAEAFSPRAGSCPHPSYRRSDWHGGGWESRSVTELEKKPDLPYLATVVPFLQITEAWKIN